MIKKTLLLTAMVVVTTLSTSLAWEFSMQGDRDMFWNRHDEAQRKDKILRTTVGARYLTRYLHRGFNAYGNGAHGTIQPYVDLDWYGTGLGSSVLWTRPNGAGWETWERIDYTIYYYNRWWPEARRQVNYVLGWRYLNYPDGPLWNSCHDRDLDRWEAYGTFTWANVCPARVIPYYQIVYTNPADGGRRWDGCDRSWFRSSAGFYHTFGVGYDWQRPWFVGRLPRPVRLYAETTYNDGAGGNYLEGGANVDHDWSHCTVGASTAFEPRCINTDRLAGRVALRACNEIT